ncbi:MAG: universal stress protein, partial [Salinirussus sp.]
VRTGVHRQAPPFTAEKVTLVPTDSSDHSIRALEHGQYLAAAFDATVHLITVVDVQGAAGPFDAGGVDEQFVTRLEEEGRQSIENVEEAAGGSAPVETAVVRGKPSEEILEYADERGIDLIAMGTAGRTGLDRYLVGSTTARTIRRAEIPVVAAHVSEENPD